MNIKKAMKIFGFLIIFGIVLTLLGIAANLAVMAANDGYMPVISQTDSPVVIDNKHRFQKNGNLFLLADRIDFSFPESKTLILPAELLIKRLDLPPEGGEITASIGDIMQWVGVIVLLIFSPALLALTGLYARKNICVGKKWKEE